MSVKSRRVLLSATVVIWGLWLSAEWVSLNPDMSPSTGHHLGTLAMRMLALVSALATVTTYLVSPILATARIWFDIGRRAQAEHCTCDQVERARVNADVIPFRPIGRRR